MNRLLPRQDPLPAPRFGEGDQVNIKIDFFDRETVIGTNLRVSGAPAWDGFGWIYKFEKSDLRLPEAFLSAGFSV